MIEPVKNVYGMQNLLPLGFNHGERFLISDILQHWTMWMLTAPGLIRIPPIPLSEKLFICHLEILDCHHHKTCLAYMEPKGI